MNFAHPVRAKQVIQIIILALSIAAVSSSCSFNKFAAKQYKKSVVNAPYDVIIVPGVPFPDTAERSILLARITWAKYLYDQGLAKNIIFSGGAVYTKYYEGKAMKLLGVAMGLPAEHCFSETRAEHSTENIWYGIKMARKMGFKSIAVASDPFQSKMLARFIKKKCGTDIGSLPIDFKILKTIVKPFPAIDAKSAEHEKWPGSIVDREGFFKRLRGTFGRHINYNEKDCDEC